MVGERGAMNRTTNKTRLNLSCGVRASSNVRIARGEGERVERMRAPEPALSC